MMRMLNVTALTTFLYGKLIVVDLVDPATILHVKIVLATHPHPGAAGTAAVFQDVLAVINKLDLCMLLGELRGLYVHGKVYLIGVSAAKEFSVWSGVDEQKLPRKDTVCTFQQIVVIASLAFRKRKL